MSERQPINFYRGDANLRTENHQNGVYFATDTKEIFTGGSSFGKNADQSLITEEIIVAGGPLADDITDNWPEAWVKEDGTKAIPAKTPVQVILRDLFLKPIDGTVSFGNVSWSPAVGNPTVTLSNTNTAEVGSKVKVTALSKGSFNKAKRQVTLTATQGYFDGDTYVNKRADNTYKFYSAESTASGTETLTCTWNGNAVDVTVNSTELEVGEGPNTIVATQVGLTASVSAIPAKTVYASTNTKTKLTDTTASKKQVASLSESNTTYTKKLDAVSKSDDVVGSYYYFIGTVAGVGLTYDNALIRSLNTKSDFVTTIADAGTEVLDTIEIPANGYTTVIAVPEGYTIKQILKLGNDGKAAWTNNGAPKTTATITLDNGDTKVYNIFYAQNEGGAVSSFTNLKIGK